MLSLQGTVQCNDIYNYLSNDLTFSFIPLVPTSTNKRNVVLFKYDEKSSGLHKSFLMQSSLIVNLASFHMAVAMKWAALNKSGQGTLPHAAFTTLDTFLGMAWPCHMENLLSNLWGICMWSCAMTVVVHFLNNSVQFSVLFLAELVIF